MKANLILLFSCLLITTQSIQLGNDVGRSSSNTISATPETTQPLSITTTAPTDSLVIDTKDLSSGEFNPTLEPSSVAIGTPAPTKIEVDPALPPDDSIAAEGTNELNQQARSGGSEPLSTIEQNFLPKPSNWFDYNPSSPYGPNHWDDVNTKDSEYYDHMKNTGNECDRNRQSPIDIEPNRDCKNDHSVGRSFKGNIKFRDLDFTILPSALRLDLDNSDANGSKPRYDWSNLAMPIRVIWVDVKIKSEHWLFGKQYAGEMQISQYLPKKDSFVIMSVFMDDEPDEESLQLEQFIREWEEVAWKRKNYCDRLEDATIPLYKRTYTYPTKEEMAEIWGIEDDETEFDINRFVTTDWYCGYQGSLTVPPCTERVYWRILDVPMRMSKQQYRRMEKLLVDQLDENCQKSTAAYNGTVNRPVQKKPKKMNVWCCTDKNWKANDKYVQEWWNDIWPDDYHSDP